MRTRVTVRRLAALAAALAVTAVSIALARPADAASATVLCAPSAASLEMRVGEVLTLTWRGDCVLEDTAVSGSSLESVDLGVFRAVSAGTSTVYAYTSNDFGSYTNTWVVKVKAPTPTPTPTPTLTPTSAPTPAPTSSSTPTPGTSATPPSATAAPPIELSPAQPISPRANQSLEPSDVRIAALVGGALGFVDTKGHPLQLLSVSGDDDVVSIVDRGMNYTWQPSNWQRLGYGDLCWGYAGYQDQGVSALFLPVATPPFSTVPADWTLSAAIVSTPRGNTVFLSPAPGQIVTGGGRLIRAVTLCARASAPEVTGPSVRAKGPIAARGAGGNSVANNPLNGVSNGCKNEGPQGHNPHCTQAPSQTTYPVFTNSHGSTTSGAGPSTAPSTTATPRPSASASASPPSTSPTGPLIPVCRATGNPADPYRLDQLPQDSVGGTGPNILYPTTGWTDIIPPTPGVPGGQNWPAGARLLYGSSPCHLAAALATPSPSASASPPPSATPTPQVTVTGIPGPTVTGTSQPPTTTPGPTLTGYGPAIVLTPVPQPSFVGYGPVTPWPPLYPVPALPQQVPTVVYAIPPSPAPRPTPTPRPTSPPSPPSTPGATPTPTATRASSAPTATPIATYPVPPSPPPYAWPTPQPSSTPTPPPLRPPRQPTLISPVLAPSVPFIPLVTIAVPLPRPTPSLGGSSPAAQPTPLTSTTPTPTPTSTPTATPSATGSVTPPTVSPSLPVGTPSPPATREPVPGTVTFLLTNGPDTVYVTREVETLISLAQRAPVPNTTGTTGTTDTTDSTGTTPTLAATGADPRAALLVGTGVLAVGLMLTPLLLVRRRRTLRVAVIVGVTATGVVLCSGVAWSTVAQERDYSAAQETAARQWGDSIAHLEFARPGTSQAPVAADPLYVFAGVDESTLTRGPGWYPDTAPLGSPGNTAIAGHRLGWGSPFAYLDELRRGDQVTVTSPSGEQRVYTVARSLLVGPDDSWVLGPDPLGTGETVLTLTTCDPPGVNTSRLIVVATLTDVRPGPDSA